MQNNVVAGVSSVQEWLFSQGVLGFALALSLYVILKLWQKIEAQQQEIAALNRDCIADAKSYGAKMQKMARYQQRIMGDEDDEDAAEITAPRPVSSPSLPRTQ